MLSPLDLLLGYRRLKVSSSAAGEVMNIFRVCGYSYSDFEFCEEYAFFSCSAVESKRIIEACEVRGITVSIEREGGLPFVLKRYRRRYGVFVGVLLCFLLIFAAGRIVWDIRVEGNEDMSEAEVISELRECGFFIGAFKDKLDIDAIETRMLVFSDEISWISINLFGTVANVEIREMELAQDDTAPELAAANLVAARGGIIEDFKDVRGELVVKIGDVVGENDLLVSGLYGDDSSSFRYTCAKGEVLARTTRDFSVEVPLKYNEKSYFDKIKQEKYIVFFEKEVKFTINSRNLPATCDTIDTIEYFETPWGTRLPFGIRTVRYCGYGEYEEIRSQKAAEELASYKLRLLMESELSGAELVAKKISGELLEDKYILRCRAECIENIAIVKEIEIEGIPPIKRSDRKNER